MANLINANSNKKYFQFHGSHYKYKKGAPLGLPISRSIFKNFLQNLEGKFIKSSSKSKALIHYPTGCLRRQCTPDFFISSYLHCMDLADPCWNPPWSSQFYALSDPLWPLRWNSWCSRDASISNDDSQCTVGARLLTGLLKLGLHGHHGSSKGDVAQPQPIHWPVNDSLRNSHSQREMCWSTTLLKWHLLHNPIVAWLWYNIIPHLIRVTQLTAQSKINMVKRNTPSSADHFRTDMCGVRSTKAATTTEVTVQDTVCLLWGESFIFLCINTLFPTLKELLCTDTAS